MMILRELPFLRLLLPFVLGMACRSSLTVGDQVSVCFGLLVILLLPLSLVLRGNWPYDNRHWPGLATGFFLFAWGWLWPQLFSMDASPLFIGRQELAGAVEVAGISGAAEERGKYQRLTLALRTLRKADGKAAPVAGRLLVYLPRTGGQAVFPDPGDTLLLRGQLRELPAAANPEAFDYRAYQAGRGIFHQVFVDPGAWQVRRRQLNAGSVLPSTLINNCRQRVLAVLYRHLPGPDERAIAAALLIGKREAIDPELKQAYAASGAIHVLAVSGLHVGIVYLGLGFLLGRLPLAGPWWRRLRGVLLLAGVWLFVLIAGAPPSAVRAGCMFSLFIIGYSMYRSSNVFNTISAAAFITLCLAPSLLKAVGFQLSYAAVAGIVTFQPRLYRLWYCPWPLVDYFWKLLTVALAAQLGTFPLSLFYFHQFPVFFWLSGWVAVPAAALILSGGIGLLILDEVPVAGFLAGKLLAFVTSALNAVIRWIEDLPGALIEGLWLDQSGLWCAYAWVLMLALVIRRPAPVSWYLLLTVTALALALRAGRYWQWHRQQQLVVYRVQGSSLVDLIAGRDLYALAGTRLDSKEEEWAAGNYRWSRGIAGKYLLLPATIAGDRRLFRAGSVIWFAGRVICIVDGKGALPRPPPVVDYLLVCNDPPVEWWDKTGIGQAGMVIIDASNRRHTAEAWEKAAASRKTHCWNVQQQGALVAGW